MFSRGIADSLHQAALNAAKRQAGAAGFVFGLTKGAVTKCASIVESLLPGRQSAARGGPVRDVEVSQPESSPTAGQPSQTPPSQTPTSQDRGAVPAPEPQVVLREPAPPAQPPVDVVEQVLAAEQEQPVGGRAGEPKGASRDETHGEAGLQRAEIEEIAEETAEASPEGSLDLETPVGTTGADTGRNPDTAEAGLQQPGTEPIVDPGTTKAVAAEQETLSKASRGAKER